MRVLVGWELGSGFGHVALLAPVVAGLLARGHDVTVALRSVAAGARLPSGARVVGAPFWPLPAAGGGPSTTAELFAGLGYADPGTIRPMQRAWAGLVDLARPDVVVAEYAPTLTLVAHGRIPVVALGTGFTVPPRGGPLPAFKAWEPALSPAAVDAEARVAAALAAVGFDGPLADLLAPPTHFVCVAPQLDPYRGRRAQAVVGPLERLDGPRAADGPAFAYLAADAPKLDQILAAIAASKVPFEVFVRGLDPAKARALAPGVRVLDAPIDLRRQIADRRLLVHHGGIAGAHEALFAGVPQVLVPKHVEQALTLRAVEEAEVGTGAFVHAPGGPERLRDAIRALAGDAAWRGRARALGAALAAQWTGSVGEVVDAIGGAAA